MEKIHDCRKFFDRIRQLSMEGNIPAIVEEVINVPKHCIRTVLFKSREYSHIVQGSLEISLGAKLLLEGEIFEGLTLIQSGLMQLMETK